jgi:hypothetical protein
MSSPRRSDSALDSGDVVRVGVGRKMLLLEKIVIIGLPPNVICYFDNLCG